MRRFYARLAPRLRTSTRFRNAARDRSMQTSYATCMLCEAGCGIAVEHEGDRIEAIRGDEADAFSRGYICPKGYALIDLQSDPDRLRAPIKRTASGWKTIGWSEALDEAADRIAEVQAKHG